MLQQCPGQDGRNWSPEDVSEKSCPACNYQIEFFKFDLMRSCPSCGQDVINPRFNLECAEWCEHAANCIGEGSTLYQEVQSIRDKIGDQIKIIYSNKPQTFAHIKEVTNMADRIGRRERYSPLTTILSALLHELGGEDCQLEELNLASIKVAPPENKIANCWQIADWLLKNYDLPQRYQEEIIANIKALGKRELPNPSFSILKDAHRLALARKYNNKNLKNLATEGARYVADKIL